MDDGSIWRFTFEDIADKLKEIVEKYELQVDVSRVLVEGFDPIALARPDGVQNITTLVSTFVQNRQLFEAIQQEMNETKDIRHYAALSDLKDLLYTSAMERDAFLKGNGEYASTYDEMLAELDPRLKNKLDSLETDDELNSLVVYILERLEDLFRSDDLHYLFLNTPTVYTQLLGKYIRQAINVFKAFAVQLRSINTFFNIGDNRPIKVIDDMHFSYSYNFDDTIHVIDTVGHGRYYFIDEIIRVGDKEYHNN